MRIPCLDERGRSFSIMAFLGTKKAGLRVLLFCENVLICHTQEQLHFYYKRKKGVWDAENSHELPTPLKNADPSAGDGASV